MSLFIFYLFKLSHEDLERAMGIGAKRFAAFEEGRKVPKWSEFLSVVFVLWANENSGRCWMRSGCSRRN